VRRTLVASLAAAVMIAGCRQGPAPAVATMPATVHADAAVPAADTAADRRAEAARERQRYVAEVRAQIAGRDTLPAGQVFRNIKAMTNVRAGQLLNIMDNGYGRSLGVGCTHCHVAGEWDSEAKAQKQVAREMAAMARAINTEYIAKIANLRSERPSVNCGTCHRGDPVPARGVPGPAR
jgi:hypothetical protein